MQVPAIATTGTPCVSSGTSSLRGSVETRAGTPTRWPRYGKSLELGRQVARVAEQRLAMAERTHDDVAFLDLGHAAAPQLDRVVARLVVLHLDGDQHAFLARNVRAHSNLLAEIRLNGYGGNFVDDNGAHLTALQLGYETSRAKP
jgi:hypothetical protein